MARVTTYFRNLHIATKRCVASSVAEKVELSSTSHIARQVTTQLHERLILKMIISNVCVSGVLQAANKNCERMTLPLQLAMLFSRHLALRFKLQENLPL